MLAVDTGNTRTKWALFDADGSTVDHGVVENAELASLAARWRTLPELQHALVACVADATVAGELRETIAVTGCPVKWVRSSAAACGVVNGYANPEQLGVDRWAALVAAWHRVHAPCVVVLAGTALTVDALTARGEFIGGLILPGFGMLRAALANGTAGVNPVPGRLSDFPDNTSDAVQSGMLTGLSAAVERQCRLLEARESVAPMCLLSGGDAQLLSSILLRPTMIVEDLVLQGLFLMGNAC